MNKINKFNVTIGILILVLCLVISFMAYMSAKVTSNNMDNVVYIDTGSGYSLPVPKSNLVTKYIEVEKDITGENGILHISVKLPKINIDTEVVNGINEQIYAKYQELYNYALSIDGNESISYTYDYDYIDREHKLAIVIKEEKKKDGNITKTETRYEYDVENNEMIGD